jgi:hypothetical protein
MRTLAILAGALSMACSGCGKDRPHATAAAPPATAAVSASAVSGIDDAARLCGAKSRCPNEPADDEGILLCTSLAREPACGARFLALVRCQVDEERCDAEGRIDQVATLDLCKAEDRALRACDQAKAAGAKASAR